MSQAKNITVGKFVKTPENIIPLFENLFTLLLNQEYFCLWQKTYLVDSKGRVELKYSFTQHGREVI
jgi:hypothetical protein